MRGLFYSYLLLGAVACVGPSSPFGGLEFGTGDGIAVEGIENAKESPQIQFSPKRQMLHQPAKMTVQIPHAVAAQSEQDYRVVYNGRDVTHAFKQTVLNQELEKKKSWKIETNNLRLAPNRKHNIAFFVRDENQRGFIKATYLPPQCDWSESRDVLSTSPFQVEEDLLAKIETHAKKYSVNKSLLAGLIAQESGFSSMAVSSARGVGLTQITPLAAQEIEKNRIQWKRYEKFDNESPQRIKKMILAGEVTDREDWRLNVDQSIEGAAIYLQYLERYWRDKDNKALLEAHKEIPYLDVILASYNSGPARVKRRILDNETEWLEPHSFKEAFRYVNAISSYCFHFAEKNNEKQ